MKAEHVMSLNCLLAMHWPGNIPKGKLDCRPPCSVCSVLVAIRLAAGNIILMLSAHSALAPTAVSYCS